MRKEPWCFIITVNSLPIFYCYKATSIFFVYALPQQSDANHAVPKIIDCIRPGGITVVTPLY